MFAFGNFSRLGGRGLAGFFRNRFLSIHRKVWCVLLLVAMTSERGNAIEPAQEARNNGSAGLETVLKGYSGQVSAVMDLDYDLSCYFHDPEVMQKKTSLLARCGFKRIYIIAPPPGDPDYAGSAVKRTDFFLMESREALGGDPLAVAVKLFKAAGFEVFVQFKPYEGGGTFTVPDGFTPPYGRNWLPTLGGRAVALDPFLVAHPEMRPQRQAIDNKLALPADRLEIVFMLDEIPGRNGMALHEGRMKLVKKPAAPALGCTAITNYPMGKLTLYSSMDNGAYKPYPGELTINEKIEKRLIRNANGELVFPVPVTCRVVEISGFNLEAPYLAVNFDGDANAFRTIPYSSSCFKAFSGETELPITVTPALRNMLLTGKAGFEANGFEFNEFAPYFWDCGWKNMTLFGIARGRADYQRGTFSEAYPEVREHWLKQIQRYIDLGCDGVDIRMMCHSAGITDFVNYSFNPPMVEAYKERYGVDITRQDPDPVKMMQLRGDFFMQFVQSAAELLHQHNRKLQLQVHGYQENPSTDPTFPGAGFWAASQVVVDWRKAIEIADEVAIKDYNWGTYDPDNARGIKTATAALGKPLWIHCYMQQGHDVNEKFLAAVDSDKRISGLMLYEVVYRPGREMDGIVEITPDQKVRLVPGSPIYNTLIRVPMPE